MPLPSANRFHHHAHTGGNKAFGGGRSGESTAEILGTTLSALGTPLVTLNQDALAHNAATLAAWSREHGVLLAPHGKTTMSPQLWQLQLEHGAWGITLANVPQLRVARRFGVSTLMLANSLVDPAGIAWVADEVAAGARIVSWVDSLRTVELIEAALADRADAVALEVIVELGGTGGRTGVRSHEDALEIARAVHASDRLRLVGAGGYEGALAHSREEAELDIVREYLGRVAALHADLVAEGLYDTDRPLLTAGGSAFFDLVAQELVPVADGAADVIIRSGAYLIHDDGFCRDTSPLASLAPGEAAAAGNAPVLRSAMTGWAHVVSTPEPGLAIIGVGKRDVSFDVGMPWVGGIAPTLGAPERPFRAEVYELNDQHGFVRFDPEADGPAVGDVVRLELSHPCTVMDKWATLPVLDASGTITDVVVTYF